MILVQYYIEKYENILKFTFHGFAANLKGFVSERKANTNSQNLPSELFFKW